MNQCFPSPSISFALLYWIRKYFYRERQNILSLSAPSGHLLLEEGGSVHASPFPWKGLPSAARRGWLSFFGGEAASSMPFPRGKGVVSRKAIFSYRSLPHWGRGTASAVDRVLSFIVDLRRSFPLFFIPLEPYPARLARHLPHAGKALFRG